MPTDVHAHYVPPDLLDAWKVAARISGFRSATDRIVSALSISITGQRSVHSSRSSWSPSEKRLLPWTLTGVDRQVLSSWCDIFGPHLDRIAASRWHRFFNEQSRGCANSHPKRFSMLASVPLPYAEEPVAELEYAVHRLARSARLSRPMSRT